MEIKRKMNKSFDAAKHDEIFLQMRLAKSLEKDADGNVIFTVEASNENLDIERQRVLQSALLGTKDYVLKNGVVSKEHKHRTFREDGGFDLNEEYVIGEPLDVFTKGASTLVKGKLYANNPYARKFIALLDSGSSRVKASVGGLIPRIKKAMENGREVGRIVSVLWDDLALTIQPVNPTVEPAVSSPLAKSLSGAEFVKALSAGYGADAAQFTGGRALHREDVEREKLALSVNEQAIASLVGAIGDGEVSGLEEAESFLADYGISQSDAYAIAREVCNKSNVFMEVLPMAKSSFWDKIKDDLRKSIGGKKPKQVSEPEDGDLEDEEEEEDEEEYEDAGPVLKALAEKVGGLQAGMETMAKAQAQALTLERLEQSEHMQKSLGEGVLALMGRTEEALASPAPRRGAVTQLEAAMAKALGSGAGGSPAGATLRPFTQATIDRAKGILLKAVGDGELDAHTCGRFETQMNKLVGKAAYPFTPDFVAFMHKKVSV
jgi:hypothetical protein